MADKWDQLAAQAAGNNNTGSSDAGAAGASGTSAVTGDKWDRLAAQAAQNNAGSSSSGSSSASDAVRNAIAATRQFAAQEHNNAVDALQGNDDAYYWLVKTRQQSEESQATVDNLNSRLDEIRKDANTGRFQEEHKNDIAGALSKLIQGDKTGAYAEQTNLQKALEQAEEENKLAKAKFDNAQTVADIRSIRSSVEAAREGATSYTDLVKDYSQSLDKLNKDRATAIEDLNRIRNGAGYYGAASTYEEDKARQEADEKDALARLEAAEKQIQRVTGMRDYAFARSTNDKGAEAVIRQGEELARTAKEQYLAGNMPDPTSNADYRTWVENNPGKTAREYAEQQYADREPNDMWTQEEKNRYFILMTDSPERAFQYAVEINSAINSETNAAAAERFANLFPNYDMSEEARAGRSGITNALMRAGNAASDVAGIAGGVATGPVKLFNWLDNIYQNNERGGYYAGNSTPRITDYTDRLLGQNTERLNNSYGTIRDDVPILGGKGLGDLYQLVESVAQSMTYGAGLSKAFSVGATTAAGIQAAQQAAKLSTGLIFFGQAADSSYNEYIQRGMSREQAAVGSFFAGLAEAMGEELSIDHLISGDIADGLAKYVAKQSFIEASEEGFTNVLNLFGDELAARMTSGESKMRQDIEALKRSGMSEEDAKRQVWKDFVDGTIFDMFGGAISGGLSSGAYAAPNALYNYVQNRNNRNQQNQQNAQPAQPTQAETNQRPATRNPLYEALNPQTPAAETATVAENATTEEPAPATPATAQAAETPTGETTTPTLEERRADLQRRLEDAMKRAETAQEEEWAALGEEFDALDAEDRQLQAEETQQARVQNGEVSKGYGTPENHIDRRTAESVAKPGMKSFQFDNPQLHDYYVDAAKALIEEVQNAEEADYERKVNKNTQRARGSAIKGPVRRLMDMGLTKPKIVKCLQDIIADNGQENYAAAKRVELILNDMLTNGWQGQRGRTDYHEPNADYIAAKDAIDGGIKADSWEKYLADHDFMILDGTVTEEELRAEWEQMRPAQNEESAAPAEAETAEEGLHSPDLEGRRQPADRAQARSMNTVPQATETVNTELSAGTIPASEQTTAERTNGMGNERERNMSRNLRGNEKAEPDLRNSFEQNRDLYTQLTNAEVAEKAAEIVGKGYDAAKNDIYEKIGQAKAGAKLAPEYAVAGYQLANEMVRRGETEAARELCADIAAELTYAGQVGQIGRLILESDPSIRIKTVDKIVDKINDSMTDRQKAKNKKRSGGKESAKKANEAAQAAQKQAADMVANALSGGDTFNFPDAAAKEVAGSIKAQIKRSLSPQKPRNALDTFVGYVKKFAREKINVGEKSKPMTSTELLREVVNNEELFMEVYEKAQAEFMGEDATGYREFAEDYINSPVGIDGTGDARNKLFMQAIVESATATSENAKTIRTQAALGVPHGEIANRIADALIRETGATGGIAESIRGSAQAYVNEIINSDEKTGDSRAESEVTAIMQAIGVKFREMAVQNKAAKDAVRRDIANMLATEYALSPDSAEKIAQSVANEYDRQLSDAMAKEVEKRFAPKEKRSKAEAKALTQQLTEAINLGTFSSDYATEAVNKIFGVDGAISVSDEALQRYAAAETKEEQNAALDAIEQEIADQIPATFRDKFTALRYLNMLGNLKTQARNVVGNAAMMTATNVKYLTQHVLELARAAATGGEYQGNTALNTSKELRQQAAADFEANKDEIEGDAKYSDVGRQAAKSIQKKRQIFGTTGNALWDNTVGRGLEGARTLTNKAMEVGDEIFLRQVYVRSFAGWMKAHGVTDVNNASPEQISAAREFAKKEAQEATFHDSNKVSDWVSSLGRGQNTPKVVKMISEGIVPFRKTPANVAVRAVEYSPVGIAGTIYTAVQAKKGNASAADVINSAAKNLTGTALFAAGMMLAAAGRARASGDDEDEKLTNFQKLQGAMDYSVKVGDKYISLSQFAPMAIPFFMGVKLNELLEYSDNLFSADSIGDILGVVSEPMLEMSMLSGVNDFLNDLSSVSGDTDALPSLIGNAALSYLSQGLTNSLLGQLEQASERNRQTTYSDTKSADATGFDRFLGKNQYKIGKYSAKIPGIDYNQQDYVDAWGRTQSNGGVGERAFNAFLNPTYTGKDRSTDVDEELERLYRENKDKDDFPDVFPQKRSRSDAIGDGVVMTPDEYLAFSKESGQKKLELVREFMQSSDYKNLTDEQRAETIHNLYAFADATALQKVRDANGVTVENKYAKISDLSDVPAYLAATERFKADAEKEGTTFNGWTNTNFEKYISSGLKDEDLDVLAENALSDARKPVYDLMREVGMSPKEYMDAITTMDGEKHDGQFKQADVYNWLTKNTTMSTEQKNQLWDMLGNNWKTSFSNYKPK